MSDATMAYFDAEFEKLALPELETLVEKLKALIFKRKEKTYSVKDWRNTDDGKLFEKFSGCVRSNITLEEVKDEYFKEKYGLTD